VSKSGVAWFTGNPNKSKGADFSTFLISQL
jgi:hypothetical protein